jgi:hypothetical protein
MGKCTEPSGQWLAYTESALLETVSAKMPMHINTMSRAPTGVIQRNRFSINCPLFP